MLWLVAASSSWVALLALAVAAVTAIAGFRQVRVAKQASRMSVFVDVVKQLQDEQARQDRAHLYKLTGKEYDQWTESDRAACDRACALLDVTGTLTLRRACPRSFIIAQWATPIMRCYVAAYPRIRYRRRWHSDARFWASFQWLAELAAHSPYARWVGEPVVGFDPDAIVSEARWSKPVWAWLVEGGSWRQALARRDSWRPMDARMACAEFERHVREADDPRYWRHVPTV